MTMKQRYWMKPMFKTFFTLALAFYTVAKLIQYLKYNLLGGL